MHSQRARERESPLVQILLNPSSYGNAFAFEKDHAMNPRDIERNEYYRPLKRNILLIVIFVSYIPLIVVGSGILYQMHTIYQEKVRIHLETLVKKHKWSMFHLCCLTSVSR